MTFKINNFFNNALPFGMVYGAIRKAYYVDTTIRKWPYGSNEETEDLYFTTKALLITWGAVSNGYLWPVAIIRDVYHVEGLLRG